MAKVAKAPKKAKKKTNYSKYIDFKAVKKAVAEYAIAENLDMNTAKKEYIKVKNTFLKTKMYKNSDSTNDMIRAIVIGLSDAPSGIDATIVPIGYSKKGSQTESSIEYLKSLEGEARVAAMDAGRIKVVNGKDIFYDSFKKGKDGKPKRLDVRTDDWKYSIICLVENSEDKGTWMIKQINIENREEFEDYSVVYGQKYSCKLTIYNSMPFYGITNSLTKVKKGKLTPEEVFGLYENATKPTHVELAKFLTPDFTDKMNTYHARCFVKSYEFFDNSKAPYIALADAENPRMKFTAWMRDSEEAHEFMNHFMGNQLPIEIIFRFKKYSSEREQYTLNVLSVMCNPDNVIQIDDDLDEDLGGDEAAWDIEEKSLQKKHEPDELDDDYEDDDEDEEFDDDEDDDDEDEEEEPEPETKPKPKPKKKKAAKNKKPKAEPEPEPEEDEEDEDEDDWE